MDKIFYQGITSDEVITSQNDTNQNAINEVIGMIEDLENGNEPILLKIVSGTASSNEINDWAQENDIPLESVDEVLGMLSSSYSIGADIAKNINEDILEQSEEIKAMKAKGVNNKEILDKLDNILESLNKIRSDVYDLIEKLE